MFWLSKFTLYGRFFKLRTAFYTTETDYSSILQKCFEYSEPVLLADIDSSSSEGKDFCKCLSMAAEMSKQPVKTIET